MDFCEKCGKKLENGQTCSCGVGINSTKNNGGALSGYSDFFTSMKNRMGIGSPERNATDIYERGMKIVPECIKAEENEIPVKQYDVAVLRNLLKFERAEGRLQVTNKRVVFRAAGSSIGGRTTLQQEFAINEIGGIEAKNNYKFSFLHLAFAFIIIFFSHFAISLIFSQNAGNMISRPSLSSISTPFSDVVHRVMNSKHVLDARANENESIQRRINAEKEIPASEEKVKAAKTSEEKAVKDTTEGILKTKRVKTGTNWYGEAIYETRRSRDKSPEGLQEAQDTLNAAIARRKQAEKNLEQAISEKNVAIEKESKAIKKRIDTENIWSVLMTIFGTLLGLGGLAAFFMLYKKFGRKLFILNFSVFGFALALTASNIGIFALFILLSIIFIAVCVFIYCFRPNFIISIINKSGKRSILNIRRETQLTMHLENGIGFSEVIPVEESESAIREIGAIIGDIQKMGELGLKKWMIK